MTQLEKIQEKLDSLRKDLEKREEEDMEQARIDRKIAKIYEENDHDNSYSYFEMKESYALGHAEGIAHSRRKIENILEDIQRTEEKSFPFANSGICLQI